MRGCTGRAEVVDRGLAGIASPEHAINGLLPTLDNAFACYRTSEAQKHGGEPL
jgi:hypothetical protein